MEYLRKRVSVHATGALKQREPLVAAMVGHCPGKHRARELRSQQRMTEAIRRAGFADKLLALWHLLDADPEAEPALYDVPVPVQSFAEFQVLFPEAATEETGHQTPLGGSRAWLPAAVADFFAAGGRLLWVVCVPEQEDPARSRDRFLPDRPPPLESPPGLRGVEVVLALDEVGMLGLPDLERLRIPGSLFQPRNEIIPPDSGFVRCADFVAPVPAAAAPAPAQPDPVAASWRDDAARLQYLIGRYRQDLGCAFALPLDADSVRPEVDAEQLEALRHQAFPGLAAREDRTTADGLPVSSEYEYLKRMMLIFPYVAADGVLRSPVGSVLGRQSARARRTGIWHSIAGQVLSRSVGVFPALVMREVVELRDKGVSVLVDHGAGVELDGEVTLVPAQHRDDVAGLGVGAGPWRSHVLSRFIGFLLRELQRLGDSLIFIVDPRDERPRAAVEALLDRLYRAGALRGRRAADAYRVTPVPSADAVLRLDIEVAPVLPVGRLRVQFVNTGGTWTTEVAEVVDV